MTKHERKQQEAKNKCIRLILDNDTMNMTQICDLLSCILEDSPEDIERASIISLSALSLCRLPPSDVRVIYGFIKAFTDNL